MARCVLTLPRRASQRTALGGTTAKLSAAPESTLCDGAAGHSVSPGTHERTVLAQARRVKRGPCRLCVVLPGRHLVRLILDHAHGDARQGVLKCTQRQPLACDASSPPQRTPPTVPGCARSVTLSKEGTPRLARETTVPRPGNDAIARCGWLANDQNGTGWAGCDDGRPTNTTSD